MSERDYIKPPPPLSYEGNVAESWKEWRQLFELYLVATETDTKPDKTKITVLLTSLGAENDNRLRDKIVFDTQSEALKERLLREKDLRKKKRSYENH